MAAREISAGGAPEGSTFFSVVRSHEMPRAVFSGCGGGAWLIAILAEVALAKMMVS